MKEIKNQLPEGIMGNIQCILSATSIEEITKLELRVKEMLKIFVDFYPHKKEEIYLVYLKHASLFHQVIVNQRNKIQGKDNDCNEAYNLLTNLGMMKIALELNH